MRAGLDLISAFLLRKHAVRMREMEAMQIIKCHGPEDSLILEARLSDRN